MPILAPTNLDRLLDLGARKSTAATMSVPDPRIGRRNSNPGRVERGAESIPTVVNRGASVPPRLEKGVSLPIPEKGRNNGTSAATVGRNNHWTQISPALYAIPKATPIPDSPSSFPPSPYVVNHKRRGPRLPKSYSEDDVATSRRGLDDQKVKEHDNNSENKVPTADDSSTLMRVVSSGRVDISTPYVPTPEREKKDNGPFDSVQKMYANGSSYKVPTADDSSTLMRVGGSARGDISIPDVLTPGKEKEDNGPFDSFPKVHANGSSNKVPSADDSSIVMRVVGSARGDISTPDVLTPSKEKEDNGHFDSVQKVHANGFPTPRNLANGAFNLANQGSVLTHFDKDPQASEIINNSADQINTGKTISSSFQVKEENGLLGLHDSASVKSSTAIDVVDGFEQSADLATAVAEFYDAWEELSSENGPQQQAVSDIEAELKGIRLSLLMEIEKRKQAEEAVNTICTQWQIFRRRLFSVGLNFPADPLALSENDQLEDAVDVLSQQLYLARFVSNSIGRGIAKAEVEMEMEAQLEFKNFEIARLSDRLRYYEAVNREMSQRNQETVDHARRLRQRRKTRQKWIWGSVAATITVGSAILAWSYIPTGKGTPSSSHSHHASES